MKLIYKTLIACTAILFLACEEKLTDLSIDRDDAIVANDSEVLTAAEGYIGIMQDVYLNGFSFLWAQYYTWGIGVSLGNAERFVAQPDDKNGYWSMAYANALADLKYLGESESPAYRGVSGILRAYVYQGLVDHFGSVPYSEALKGELADGSILTPQHDDPATIYSDLVISLDAAIAEIELADADEIGDSDIIYGGDLNQWIKFANSLKLRLLLRTSEVDPKESQIVDLIRTGVFISEESDIAEIQWTGTTGNENPLFATQTNGVGDFYFASNGVVNVMNNLNDPRLTFFYSEATTGSEAGTINAIDQGAVDRDVPFTDPPSNYSLSSDYANGPTVSTILMSPWEVWFLRSEAAARYTTVDDDVASFSTAVQMNFDHIGASGGSAYIAELGYGPATPFESKLNLIAIQKWISFNGTQEDEGWIETRRFDRPGNRIFTDGIFQTPPSSVLPAGSFPASWLYPSSEVSFNPGNVPNQRNITDKLFWDN